MSGEQTFAQVGEFGLINQATRHLTMPPNVAVGPGDDAAVYLLNGSAVTSTDMMVQDVHFKTQWSSAADVGHKIVAVNVADIEAMGAEPSVMVLAVGAPTSTPAAWLREFSTGAREEAEKAGIAIVGGDLTASSVITVCGTVIGQTKGLAPVLRSGAEPGDVVAVKGRLGWAAAGLAALGRGFRSPRVVVDSQRQPQVPYGAGREAARAGAHAMIDISDGLLGDLRHIADASGVHIDVETARLTIDEPVATVGAALNVDPLSFVLTGGEDHGLAACFAPGTVPDDWQVIGLVSEGDAGISVDGAEVEGPTSWTHFSE